jgi:hypothetical protein
MKGLLLVLVLVVVGVLGFGFYRGWFHVTSDSAEGESNVTFTVDKNKIEEDRKKVQQKAQDLGHSENERTGVPTEEGKK